MAKTVRFASVVAKSGTPALFLAWSAPEKDPAFARASKEYRVMTLHQQLRGGKKDYGTLGFIREQRAQYLIFPKSLRSFGEAKVVAIDYALFAGELEGASKRAEVAQPLREKKIHEAVFPRVKKPAAEVLLFPTADPAKTLPERAPQKKEKKKESPRPKRLPMVTAVRTEVRKALEELRNADVREAETRLSALLGEKHPAM